MAETLTRGQENWYVQNNAEHHHVNMLHVQRTTQHIFCFSMVLHGSFCMSA